MVYWERRRKCVKIDEGTWLATRKKNIFLSTVYLIRKMYVEPAK